MASPYDSAIDMFNLPRYAGLQESFVFPRRQDPADNARRNFLEGGSQAAPEDEEWNLAMQSPDPMGVMEELKKVREERETEDLIASIAELDPAAKDYLTKIRGTMAQQPKAFATPAVGRILDFQQRMMPPKRPAPTFQYPQFQSQYQKLIAGGTDPQAATDQVQMAEQQYGLQRQLAASGLPFDSPELMTDNQLDELKVLQTLARAKNEAKQKTDRIPVPNELNKALQEAYSSEDEEMISDAANAIIKYQARMASILASGKQPSEPQLSHADLKRVDMPAAETVTGTVTEAPTKVTETVKGAVAAPPAATQPPSPTLPKDEQANSLWNEYMELENATRVDSKSTNPADEEANRELRGEMNGVRKSIMDKLKIPDTDKGRKLFENLWLGRKNSMSKTEESRGTMLSPTPIEKKGATGNSWAITPA